MKKAKAYIQTVWCNCPYCLSVETVDCDSGSMSIDWAISRGVRCLDCGKVSAMPKTAETQK